MHIKCVLVSLHSILVGRLNQSGVAEVALSPTMAVIMVDDPRQSPQVAVPRLFGLEAPVHTLDAGV